MGAESDLIITIDAKADKAKEVISDLLKDSEHLGEGLQLAALAGVAAFGALVAGITISVEKFEEHDLAVRQLNNSLQNQGMYTEELSNQYKENAKALEEKTGADEDAIIKGQALMQSLIGQRTITPELTKAIVDMSAATGVGLEGAFMAASRAVETGTLSIGRFHIQLDPTLDKSQRLAAVQEILGQKFGGAADEAVKGLGGWALVKAQFDDLERQVGEQFAPAFTAAMGVIRADLAFLGPIVKDIAKTWGTYWPMISAAFDAFAQYMIQKADGIRQILTGLIHLSPSEIKQGVATYANAATDSVKVYHDEMDKGRAEEVQATVVQNDKKRDLAKQANAVDDQLDRDRAAAAKLKREVDLLEITAAGSKVLELKKRQLADLEKASKTHDTKTRQALEADAKDQVKQQSDLGKTLLKVDADFHTQKMQQLQSGLSEVASMQQSHNAALKTIGKAAAIADIIISTESAVMKIISGFSAIPFIGYELGLAVAAAAVAYSGERIANVISAADGGLITGGIAGKDSVPAMLMPGEMVVPTKNFDEVVGSVAASRAGQGEGGGGQVDVQITMKGDAVKFIEAEIIQRQRLRTSLIKS